MPAPTSFNTPARIIRLALEDAGILPAGEEPNSDQYARYSDKLNDLINLWMVKDGLKLWTRSEQTLTLVAGQAAYTIMVGGSINIAKPVRIIDGYYRDSAGNKQPLWQSAWVDYLRLAANSSGRVSQFFVDKQVDRLAVKLWPTPDAVTATGTVVLLVQEQITNFTGVTDTMDFSPEWFIALRWGLADEAASGQPQAIMDRCAAKSEYYYTLLSDNDVEEAPVRFQASAMTGVPGRFR